MPDIYIVAYDGREASKRAALFAAERAQLAKASLHLVHILEWSPYSFLTPDELEERHRRRREEIERANEYLLVPLANELTQAGHTVTTEVRYGNVAKTLKEIADEKQAKLIFIARANDSKLSMILGSVPSTLIQIASVPVTVVP